VYVGSLLPKLLQHIDEHIPDQILARSYANLARSGIDVKRPAELVRPFQEAEGMGQKTAPLVSQDGRPPRAATLSVQLDTQSVLQSQKAAPKTLLGDAEHLRRGTDLTLS
jgi:hypothetical protein